MTTKRLFIPMTKYDAAKGIAYGVAASSTLDRAGEIFDYSGSKPYFEKWSAAAVKATAGKSAGNLRSMHGAIAAGLIQSITFNDDDELIEVAAKVVDANEQKKCEEGVYTGFSMGGKYIKKWKDGDAQRYIADPYEISLVDLPCIPDATFEYVKGAATEIRKFHVEPVGEVKEPSNDDVVAEAHKLAAIDNKPEAWLEFIGAARKSLSGEAPAEGADLEPKHVLEIAVTAVDDVEKTAGSDDLGAVQQWTHPRLPGKGFEKKADLRAAIAELDATETAAKLAAPVTDALKGLAAVLDERDPAGAAKNSSDNPDFGGKDAKDKKDPKAKPDADAKAKQKAKDEADKSKPMKSAVDVIARAKEWMANPVPSFVERREIVKAAAEHNATAALPAGFIDEPIEPLAKVAGFNAGLAKQATLYSVSSLISILASLDSLEEQMENGGSGYDYYSSGTTKIDVTPETMMAVRTALTALGGACSTLLDEVLSAMTAEDAEKAIGRGTVLGGLFKIGARNSKADQGRLAKAHDLLAEINPAMCGGASKDAGDGDLAKVMKAQEAAFTKTLEGIGDVIKDVAERVKRIEAQPINGRPTSVNVVEKGHVLESVIAGHDPEARTANHEAFIAMTGELARLSAPQR